MADAELTVRISGDTGDLESAISRVESQLSRLERSDGRGAESIAKAALNQGGFAKTVEQSKKALDEKRAVLAQTEKEYKKNSKAIQDNISGLEKQRGRLNNLAVSKQEEIDALKASSKNLDKNSTAYKDNRRAIEWTETELEAVKKQHRDVGKSIDEHRTALQNEKNSLEKSRNAVADAEKQYKTYASNLEEVEKIEKRLKLEEKAKGYRELGDGVDTLTKPFQVAGVAMAAGAVASAKFAIDFNNNFADVRKTVDGTDAQLNKIKQDIIDMTTVDINGHSAIPQTTAELTELAAAGGQLGIKTENISSFTETMAMMGSATNLAGEEGAKTLARFMNVANVSQDKVQNLGSSIVDLGNHFATTEAEIAAMAQRMGATGTAVGISAQDILAYSTALSSLGVEADAKVSGKTTKEFAEGWKNDASGTFKDFVDGLSKSKDLVGTLKNLGFDNILDLQALQKLAGPQGIQLLTDALQRSNNAWSENTALVNEFENKAGTTASKIQVMKNNLVEAGRSLGETFLPSINNGVTDIKNFAQGIANMSDGQKQALITTGKWVIGLGAAGKATSGVIKGIGNTADAFAKIKKAKEAGGVLAKFAPALTAIKGAAPYAAAGIIAVTAAVKIGKAAYDSWYKSNYAWTDGLSEQQEQLKKSYNSYKKLSDIQNQLKNFNAVIKNPESSQEQVDKAKQKIQEIAALLEKEYNLKIKSDNSNLDETVAKIKDLKKYEYDMQYSRQTSRLQDLQPKFDSYASDYVTAENNFNKARDAHDKYVKLNEAVQTYYSTMEKANVSQEEFDNGLQEIVKQCGLGNDVFQQLQRGEFSFSQELAKSETQMQSYLNQMNSLQAAHDEYIAINEELANQQSELLAQAVKENDVQAVENHFNKISESVKRAGLDMHGYAQIAAEAFNGIKWDEAFKKGGDDLNNMVNDYVRSMQKFGAANSDIAKGAALLKNGFKSINDIPKDNKKAFDAISKDMTEFARNLGEIDGNHSIKITADGDIQLLDDVSGKIQEIQTSNGTTVKITAEGDVSVLDDAGNQVQYLEGLGAVSLQVNANGNIDVLNEAGEKVAEIPKEVDTTTTVKMAVDSAEVDNYQPDEKTGTAKYGVDSSSVDNWSPPNKNAIVVYKAVVEGEPKAKGTQDFKGGMAMINDQRGVSDPRELVEVNGKGYIFEGRDVVLPLPRHAKVYTAGQTKEMLAMAGLRRYARGKDNKEWENAQDDWAHYTKVNNVSAFEALEHWDEMMKKFSYDAEAVKDIQEEIVASTKDMWDEEMATMQFYLDMGVDSEEHYYKWLETYRDEHFDGNDEMWRKATLDITKYNKRMAKESAEALNDASEEYIRFHTIAGDWDEIGDSPLAAYARVLDRAEEDLANGVYESVEEKNEFLKNFGSNMFDAYKEDADNWIQHERDYNAMSTEDYISALNRKKQRTNEYFAQGIIDYQTYLKEVQDYNEKIMNAYADEVNQWRDDADFYQRQSEVYGWGFNGTGHKSALKYWQARLDREIENSHDMNLSANERQSALRYADEARMEIYKARQDELDDELGKFRQSIEDTRTALDDEVQNMRDAWTTEDRKADMSELAEQIAVFKYAQTKEGIDKYKSLNEEYTRLSREQKIEDIQAANSEKLDRMQAQYDKMEQDKIDELAGLKDELLKYGGIAVISDQTRQIAAAANDNISALVSNMSDFGESFSSFAARLFEKLDERPTVINNYDNSTQNIANNIRDRADLQAAALGVGLGSLSMMLFGRRG
ncbi:MAG: phage tail tape measure protein [Clostridiales bacterium]|nr:phage tail tape measure protein [Clostridiales bacterium]